MLKRVVGVFREPLLQFGLIGAVLFAISVATRPDVEDPRHIRVDAEVHQRLADIFETERQRLPTSSEMDEMVDRFVVNETLYREARSLQLDHGDEMIRERLMQRIRLMMYSGIVVENPPREELRAWYQERLDFYTNPATLSLRVIGLDAPKDDAQAAAEQANATEAAGERLKPGTFHVVNLQRRPRGQLVQLFGEEFIADIEVLPRGVWTPVDSPRGWQVVQFQDSTESNVPDFDDVFGEVLGDWRNHQIQSEARASLQALSASYTVERLPYTAEVVSDPTGEAVEGDVGETETAQDASASERSSQ